MKDRKCILIEERCSEIIKKHKERIQQAKAEKKLTIDKIEAIIVETSKEIDKVLLEDGGEEISEVEDEKWDACCPICGRRMGLNKRDVAVPVTTIKGSITNVRDYYFCRRCHEGIGKNDKILRIDKEHLYTKNVMEHMTYAAQNSGSFERASQEIKKYKELEISSGTIWKVSEGIGKKVFEGEMKEAKELYANPARAYEDRLDKDKQDGTLNIMMDGVMLPTNTIDEDGKMQWKEVKLGEIFTDRNIIKNKNGDCIILKKEYTAYLGSSEEFKKILFAKAIRGGYGQLKRTTVIGDGAPWIDKISVELFPDAVHILDYYHLSENVHKYAAFIYPEDEVTRIRWTKSILDACLEGRVDEAVQIVYDKKVDDLPSGAVNLPEYIDKNKHKIDYKKFKDEGYFIGSGAVESGNKMVIQKRMVQSGMHWGLEGGQYIATLRAKFESNLWADVEKVIGL